MQEKQSYFEMSLMQSKLVEPKNKNMELKPGIRSPATSFCRHLLRRSSNSHPFKKKKSEIQKYTKQKPTKRSTPLEAFLTNRSPIRTEGAYFQSFFFSTLLFLCASNSSKKKRVGGKEKHNKLLSWIKRERQYTLCQSWIKKKKERE